jgi:cytidylate kinase
MGYRAVALSQVDGTGGGAIGRQAASRLGFGYLDEAIIAQVARDHGMDAGTVAEAERRKSFFTRVAEAAARGAVDPVVPDPSVYDADQTDTLLSLIQDAVLGAAGRGSVVLAAHAACYACAGRTDVLRVCVTAPPATRLSRVAAARSLSDREAARWLRHSDAGRASYLKRVYGASEESPADYDLVINTERLAPDVAAGLIAGLVQAPPPPSQAPVTTGE